MLNIRASVQPFAQEERNRESRLQLALLRGVLENLKPNRMMMPLFALGVCVMFSPWVGIGTLSLWYAIVLVSLVPQFLVTRMIPAGILSAEETGKWKQRAAAANLFYVMGWTSLGWLLWVPGNDFNHLLIQLVLATTLTAHALLVGPSPAVAVPAFCWYGVVTALVPLQNHAPVYYTLAAVTPLYVGYVAMMARQHHARARAALVMTEERNALLAELVCAKLESDRGREKAEAASLAKSQFLANMSHELRTPLNAIIGFSELISTRIFASDQERNYEYAKMIHGSGMHLLNLINDILDLAKIEAGRWKLEEHELDLQRTAADALQLVSWRAEGAGVNLVNAVPDDLPFLHGDARALKQIMINLLSNAVKFTQNGGSVTVFAEEDAFGNLEFGVADTGIGIAPEDLQRVFDSFGQGKHDVAIADKGTGLGLAIVRGLIEAHGGTVTLDSEVGKGTRATVTFPAARLRSRARLQSKVA
ncbi:MAG: HAMP domain-containing histidine kinase [Alphaproteobacteria bacterium]|nr:HAMP domain-containing histidine kinase [Alphaproteobacteria bacterium]